MSVPAIVLTLPLEGGVRVYIDALSEGDVRRLGCWLASAEPRLAERVLDALREARLRLAGDEEGAP